MAINAGIDIGSVVTKCMIIKDQQIIARSLSKTGVDTQNSAQAVFDEALKQAKIRESEVSSVVSTGYGRRIFKQATKVITEIAAVGYGAYTLLGEKPCLIVDVGGQDTKIVEVSDKGKVVDFLMNDKCAAGTGRFLEMMATVLETDLDGLSVLASKFQKPVMINSTCSVFAESEVVSLIAQATSKEDIAAGLFNAITERLATMLRQFGRHANTVFCGGGAKSAGLKAALEKITNRKITILDNPQFVTAFGAAISN